MSNTPTEPFRISGSIDLVTVGLLIAAGGYAAASLGGSGYAYYMAAFGLLLAAVGVVKVSYDHATGFPDTEDD